MTKLNVGDRVAYPYSYDSYRAKSEIRYSPNDGTPYYGVIGYIASADSVMVTWDGSDRPFYGADKPIAMKKLYPEAEFKAKYSELEAAFHAVEAKVRDKIAEASRLIREAQEETSAVGYDLQELTSANDSLEGAMSAAGWNTSSWHC